MPSAGIITSVTTYWLLATSTVIVYGFVRSEQVHLEDSGEERPLCGLSILFSGELSGSTNSIGGRSECRSRSKTEG